MSEPIDEPGHEVRFVQPYQADKAYRCPGCDQEIAPRTHHVVAIPDDAPDLRRHWHTPCWRNRTRRRPTGRKRPPRT